MLKTHAVEKQTSRLRKWQQWEGCRREERRREKNGRERKEEELKKTKGKERAGGEKEEEIEMEERLMAC